MFLLPEPSINHQAGHGISLCDAEYQGRAEARPKHREDGGGLLGTIPQTARRHEVPGPSQDLRQGQHPTSHHEEDPFHVSCPLVAHWLKQE